MMGRRDRDQGRLFYAFNFQDRVPANHLLRRIDPFVTVALEDLHAELRPFYSDIGRPSVDPELMIRMLIVGYCYGIRPERRLCQEVDLNLAYRWFCRLDLDDPIPHHATFSVNRLGRFRESDILRHVFEKIVGTAMMLGLVKGEGFAVDASVVEANASRYHGKEPSELNWSDKQRGARAVQEYLAALEEIAIAGTHKAIRRTYVGRYFAEFQFRFNGRHDLPGLFTSLLAAATSTRPKNSWRHQACVERGETRHLFVLAWFMVLSAVGHARRAMAQTEVLVSSKLLG